jgi:RimJ/RimL family protein N-acetyltransferase
VTSYWPLAELVLRCDSVELRPLTEADLPALVDVLPDDVELDPGVSGEPGRSGRDARATMLARSYWRSMATWSAAAWCLPLVTRFDGHVAGLQTLEGDDFAALRTVDTASWLAPRYRGRGLGRRMRTAVLDFAFTRLHAEFAITSAVAGNAASLGVSRSLGYADNGHARIRTPAGVQPLVHLRLDARDWAPRWPVSVEGADAALPLFGL